MLVNFFFKISLAQVIASYRSLYVFVVAAA